MADGSTDIQEVSSQTPRSSHSIQGDFWFSERREKNMNVFWDVAPSSLVEIVRRFGGAHLKRRFYEAPRHIIPEDSHQHTIQVKTEVLQSVRLAEQCTVLKCSLSSHAGTRFNTLKPNGNYMYHMF
jgi:hypothetical protein